LVTVLATQIHRTQIASLVTQTISKLVCGSNSSQLIRLLRQAGCCSVLVRTVHAHLRRRGVRGGGEAIDSEPDCHVLLLRELLRAICSMINVSQSDRVEMLRCRKTFLREGAHEAVVLVMKGYKVIANGHPTPASEGTGFQLYDEISFVWLKLVITFT
jgi:hypothetical protein